MLTARWAHRTLLAFCMCVVLGMGIYAGLEGWLGQIVQGRVRSILDPILELFPNPEFLDRIARVLGAIGTALTAAFGVYKGIYYADRNLPERLKQLLERTDERLRRDREPLMQAVVEVRAGARVRPSVFYVYPLGRALSQLGYSDLETTDKSLKEAIRQIQDQLDVSERHKMNLEEQKLAAHILRGSIASARAEYDAGAGQSPDDDRHSAEAEFTHALNLRPGDLDALELRGRQRELRGNYYGALGDYENLAVHAEEANSAPRTARAYRLQGELMERHATTQKALTEASRRLDSALKAVNTIGSLKQKEIFEKGLTLKSYGRVQIARKKLPSARTLLRDAAACFNGLKAPEATSHARDVEEMLKGIASPAAGSGAQPGNDRAEHSTWLRRIAKWLRSEV